MEFIIGLIFLIIGFVIGALFFRQESTIKLEQCDEFDSEIHGLDYHDTGLILKALYRFRDKYPNRDKAEIEILIRKMIERRNIIEMEEIKQHPEILRQF